MDLLVPRYGQRTRDREKMLCICARKYNGQGSCPANGGKLS